MAIGLLSVCSKCSRAYKVMLQNSSFTEIGKHRYNRCPDCITKEEEKYERQIFSFINN